VVPAVKVTVNTAVSPSVVLGSSATMARVVLVPPSLARMVMVRLSVDVNVGTAVESVSSTLTVMMMVSSPSGAVSSPMEKAAGPLVEGKFICRLVGGAEPGTARKWKSLVTDAVPS